MNINCDIAKKPPIPHRPISNNPNYLAPEDAFDSQSIPRRQLRADSFLSLDGEPTSADGRPSRPVFATRRRRGKDRGRSGSRVGRGVWKKLLWVKQKDYPDNYTDPPTFLSHLQRNPRLRPYDFWPLVSDSTVIVQHISSVAIFVCSFVGIYQEWVSPVTIASWGSVATVLGWVLWDYWVGQEAASKAVTEPNSNGDFVNGSAVSGASSPYSTRAPTPSTHSGESSGIGPGLSPTSFNLYSSHKGNSHSSQASITSGQPPVLPNNPSTSNLRAPSSSTSSPIPLTHNRLKTAKSAVVICITLRGVSPILKSLTQSWSPDSIWAMTSLLVCINILFFDYSGGTGVKFPAVSTCAAIMASTVLASRLPSTTHAFSLMLFSVEVFGLFPVFRRHLRHISWRGHLMLTLALVIGAGASLGTALSKEALREGGWKRALAGAIIWGVGSAAGMGGCSWWLIGLQRYKNVVIGPWDPARPVIRGGLWE